MVRIFLILGLMPVLVLAEDTKQDVLFNTATEAYNNGAYQEAISLYNQILDANLHSAALYYNLGNAHYKLGEIAPLLIKVTSSASVILIRWRPLLLSSMCRK